MKKFFGLQWHLTNECDQRCQHCYIWQKHDNFGFNSTPSIKQCEMIIENFISFCSKMNVSPYFSITGGDPLLYKNIWEVLKIIKKRNIGFTILGNPFHLNNHTAKKLKELGCTSYQMSLDGLETTHDSLRKPGSFRATLSSLSILHQAGIRSMIMSTASLLNYKELPDVAKICTEYKVGSFAFSRYCPTHGDTEYNIEPQIYRKFLADMWLIYNELIDCGTNFSLKDHLWIPFLFEEGLYELCQEKNIVFDGCNCAIKHMTLLPNGTVYACRRFDSLVGDIYQQSFKEIFLSQEMETYRQIEKLEGCKNCDLLNYCRGCHAVAAGTTGNFFSKDPQCWRC